MVVAAAVAAVVEIAAETAGAAAVTAATAAAETGAAVATAVEIAATGATKSKHKACPANGQAFFINSLSVLQHCSTHPQDGNLKPALL